MGFVPTQLLSFFIQIAWGSFCASAQRVGFFIATGTFYMSWNAV